MVRRLAIIGSTGSIGTQTLEIVRRHPEMYAVKVLSAGRRVDELIAQALEFRPAVAVIADEGQYAKLRRAVEPYGIEAVCGEAALCEAIAREDVDMVVTATVGYSGLAPTIAAIRAGKDIALANKETMVVAGAYVRSLLENSSSKIYPIDSEHSAIYQCLQGEDRNMVERLIITGSGGPFRTWTREEIARANPADALRHPNWSMGAKITIDSATLVNKAFEIIEARWLFDIPAEKISAVIHPQSVVHSLVEFTDGAIKAQLGIPSMMLPIAYALGMGTRLAGCEDFCSLLVNNKLTFEEPDPDRFPGITLARTALDAGGNVACTINAANEIAVDAFLKGEIPFPAIIDTIFETLPQIEYVGKPDYDDFVATNSLARTRAREIINKNYLKK